MILASLFLHAQVRNKVATHLNHSTAQGVCLNLVTFTGKRIFELDPTSLSSCFAIMVICLITCLGASSENFMKKVDTDLGPLVSLLLNSLLLNSRIISSANCE